MYAQHVEPFFMPQPIDRAPDMTATNTQTTELHHASPFQCAMLVTREPVLSTFAQGTW
jgi:hypothetical protein